jgi:acyl-CoA reductase-like NAD-dependent aldehyde dehydrogenase
MLKVMNPATGELIRELPEDTHERVKEKFLSAKEAQRQWGRTPLAERGRIVQKFGALLKERKEALAATLTAEVGKPITQSRNEINGIQNRLDFFLENINRAICDEAVFSEGTLNERLTSEPLGVIANISAWNFPYSVGCNVFVPAILTGNSVLYKPSEFASLTGLAIADLWQAAGLPQGVFIPVIGGGQVGSYLLKEPVNGIFFTGSYRTGQAIAEIAAPRLLKLQLELGGKDPAYVVDDVDIPSVTASLADGTFYNTGQSCCSVERIYVHTKIFDAFLDNFVPTVKGFILGDPKDERTYLGPLTRAAQVKVLENQVQDAIKKGAKVLLGGKRAATGTGGNYFEATVLTEVNHSMQVMREESFGPIIGIQRVSGDAEAIQAMNDTLYGLTAAVYSKDESRARAVLSQLQCGTVYWNCCDRVSPRLPWSGRQHSGMGSTLGLMGLQTFTQPKAWHLRKPN